MNRRAFFRLGGAAAIGLALDPEKLLWVPGQKTYVFMSRPEWKWSGWHEAANMLALRGSWYTVPNRLDGMMFVAPSYVFGESTLSMTNVDLEIAKQNAYESAVESYRSQSYITLSGSRVSAKF